ncbi:hypothetical protein AHAS_Ahas04G0129700 [Arachis hypogaea]
MKWMVKLTWFQNTVCGELEQDATEERLMRYTRRFIMQLIERFGCPGMAVSLDVPGYGAWPAQFGIVRQLAAVLALSPHFADTA